MWRGMGREHCDINEQLNPVTSSCNTSHSHPSTIHTRCLAAATVTIQTLLLLLKPDPNTRQTQPPPPFFPLHLSILSPCQSLSMYLYF